MIKELAKIKEVLDTKIDGVSEELKPMSIKSEEYKTMLNNIATTIELSGFIGSTILSYASAKAAEDAAKKDAEKHE